MTTSTTAKHTAEAPETDATGAQSAEEKSRDTLQREAYSAAQKTLREAHREEFNGYMKTEAAARGVDWSPRPTAKEKARAALAALLAENPDLAAELQAQQEA